MPIWTRNVFSAAELYDTASRWLWRLDQLKLHLWSRARIYFNILGLAFKTVHELAPPYINSLELLLDVKPSIDFFYNLAATTNPVKLSLYNRLNIYVDIIGSYRLSLGHVKKDLK